jgi:hypothetical protein
VTLLLGPLDAQGRVPAQQQTRVAAFLLSAHGAHARRLAVALPTHLNHPWHAELHTQFCREMEFLSLLATSTKWVPDLALPMLAMSWELAWAPVVNFGASDARHALLVDTAAFGHALHGAIRPAALLPIGAAPTDPFVQALNRIEFESGRLIQAQTTFLRESAHTHDRNAVTQAVERRHEQVRGLWSAMLRELGVG